MLHAGEIWILAKGKTGMAEGHKEEGQQSEQENQPVLTKQKIHRYFQRLREKHTKPGEDHPDFRYYLVVAFWIVMVSWWVFSFLIQMTRANGNLLEGRAGLVFMLIERVGYITLGIAVLVWWKKDSSKKFNWQWWLCAAGLAAAAFLGLRNPIRDIPCLNHPTKEIFQNWQMEADTDYENSSFYTITVNYGTKDFITFYVNKSTIQSPQFSDQGAIQIEYLPYTKTVISVRLW